MLPYVPKIVPAEILDACAFERLIPGFGADLLDGFPQKTNTYVGCFSDLLAYDRHRFAIQRHGDGPARFGLVGVNPRQLSRQIDLLSLQTGDIRRSQARRERECGHVQGARVTRSEAVASSCVRKRMRRAHQRQRPIHRASLQPCASLPSAILPSVARGDGGEILAAEETVERAAG